MATFDASDGKEPEFSRTDAAEFVRDLRSRLQRQPGAERVVLERVQVLMLLSVIDEISSDGDE